MGTFWKIIGLTGIVVIVVAVLDKLISLISHDKPDYLFISVIAIITAMALSRSHGKPTSTPHGIFVRDSCP